jgi:autotransporter-associated beta strand protein
MRKFHLQQKDHSRRARAISTAAAVAAAAVSFAHTKSAMAIIATWTGATDDNWSDVGNWNSAVPGNDTGSITNTDTAIFNSAPASNVVNLDVGNWDIGTVEFTGSSTNFDIGATANAGNSLELTGGTGTSSPTTGNIYVASSVSTANSISVNAPIDLEASSGASNFVFENDSSTTGIKFQGQISAGTTVTPTLYLTGSSTSTSNQFLAPIVNGAASAINMIKTGSGEWQFESATASTNSGTLTVENGTINIASATGISPNVSVVVGDNADAPNFNYSVATTEVQPYYNGNAYPTSTFPSIQSLTVLPGGQFTEANGACAINAVTQSGFGLELVGSDSVVSDSSDPKYKGAVGLEGTGPAGTDGLLFVNSTTAGFSISDEKALDLGSVNRTFYSTHGTTTTDVQLDGIISGTGGVIKAGPGVMKFESNGVGDNNTFTGTIEVQQGTIKLVGANGDELQGTNSIFVDGGTLNLNGSSSTPTTASTGAVVVTSGTISNASNNILYAPSYAFTPSAGNSVNISTSLGDESGATIYLTTNNTATSGTGTSAVLVSGAGTVTFGGIASSYTGGTTITGGGTLLANAANTGISPLSSGSVNIGGGTLFLNPGNATMAVAYSLASAPSSTLTYAGGAILGVKNGSNPSETVTIGNSGAASNSVLTRSGNGTLVLYVNGTGATLASNLGSAMGATMQVLVQGGVSTTNGIVNPSIVGDNSSNSNGDFLTYNNTTGFNSAASLYISSFGASNVYQPTAAVALAGPESAYAIQNGAFNIDLEGNILTVGSGSGQAGIILNGAAIEDSAGGGALAFGGAEGVVYSSNGNPTISAKITGTDGLTLFGPGDLTLSGNNAGLSGGLNINQGTVTVNADADLGSSTNPINFNGGTLQFSAAFSPSATRAITLNSGDGTIDTETNTIAVGSAIGGVGSLTKVGAGDLVLTSSSNSYSGGTIINAGNLRVGNGSTGSIGSGSIVNNGGLIFNLSGNTSVSSVISGSGTVSQSGGASSVVNLSGSNTYTGATNIGSGTLQVGSANALGFGGQIVGSGGGNAVVTSGGTLDLNGQSLNKIVVLNGGNLVNSNNSTAASIATGVQSYTVTSGGTGIPDDLEAVSGGTGTGANLKLLLGLTSNSFAVTTQGTSYSNTPTVVISGGGGTGATATAIVSSGAITGFNITNPGVGYWGTPTITVTDSSGSGVAVTANQDDFTAVGAVALLPGSGYTTAPTVGSYTVGGFGLVNGAAIGPIAAPSITANIDQLEVQSNSSITGGGAVQLVGPVTGASSGATPTLTLGGTSPSNSISGVISNGTAAGLAINNTGTWTISGANTYTGGTTLTSGLFIAANGSNGSATGTGNVTLNGGTLATPAGANGGTITGTLVAGSGAHTIAPGGVGSIGLLNVGAISTNSNTTFDFDLGAPVVANSYTGDLINILAGGTLSVGAGTQIAFGTNPTTIGDYELFEGSFGTPTLTNFVLPSQAGFTYSLSTAAQSGFVDLVVSAGSSAGPVFWDNAGAGSPTNGTTWDTTNNNWNNGSSATTYADPDPVTFNDTNAGHYFVTLTSTVSPASVTVNSSGNYTISGAGGVAGAGGLIVATGGFTKTGTSTLTLGVGLTASSLAINQGRVNLAAGTTANSGWTSTNPVSNINVSSLTIAANSVLDIANNHIIIDYGATDPMSTILGYLKSGFNNGGWNGTSGIISTNAQTKTNSLTYSIGWADGADKTGAVKNLTSGEIELKYTLVGDANLDGTVNGSDFSILAANFGLGVTNWDQGNFLYGSSVNGSDFSALAANFGQGDSGAAVTPADIAALDSFAAANGLPAPAIAAVPEPATLGLLATGAIGLMTRRRRRN